MTYREEIRERCRQLDRVLIVQARPSFARLAPEEQRKIAEYIVARALETTAAKSTSR